MRRYIDADEITDSLTNTIQKIKEWNDNLSGFIKMRANGAIDAFTECVTRIKATPTADVEEVKHGKWIVCGTFDDFLKCSECGAKYPAETAVEFKGCPICRAKNGQGEKRMNESAILEVLKAIENHTDMLAGLALSVFMINVAILIYVIANYNK